MRDAATRYEAKESKRPNMTRERDWRTASIARWCEARQRTRSSVLDGNRVSRAPQSMRPSPKQTTARSKASSSQHSDRACCSRVARAEAIDVTNIKRARRRRPRVGTRCITASASCAVSAQAGRPRSRIGAARVAGAREISALRPTEKLLPAVGACGTVDGRHDDMLATIAAAVQVRCDCRQTAPSPGSWRQSTERPCPRAVGVLLRAAGRRARWRRLEEMFRGMCMRASNSIQPGSRLATIGSSSSERRRGDDPT